MTDTISKDQYGKWAREIAAKINVGIHDEGVAGMTIKKAKMELYGVSVIKERTDMGNIFKIYEADNAHIQAINSFLKSNLDMVPVLVEAGSHLKRIFGKSLFYLEVEKDPDEGFEELYIIAKGKRSPESAVSLREQFGREWLIPHHSDLIGRLNLDVETN